MNTFTVIPLPCCNWSGREGKTHIIVGRTKCEDPADEQLIAACGLKQNPLLVVVGEKECNCKKCLRHKQ